MRRICVPVFLVIAGLMNVRVEAQLLATDDFESYSGSPVSAIGGSGDWTSLWGYNSQTGGGVYLSSVSKIDSTKSAGLYGLGSSDGESISRSFPVCTNLLTINWSMRGDFNANSTNTPANLRRMAFTIRNGNGASHFANQRLSFFFAAGSTNFQWYDGANHSTNGVNFTLGHIYDLRVTMNPTNRAYSFIASNRNNGTSFSYSGNWTLGSDGEPMGSVAFMMRGPTGSGNDAFLDSVSVSSPDYTPPPPPFLPLREGALWYYYKGASTPPAQGTNEWYSPAYNSLFWEAPSPSGFGYGDSDDATILSDMQNGYLSLFTRTSFIVTNKAAITQLTLAADYDDGFVAYLNGVEVARRNLPTGTVINTTAALSNREASRSGQDNYTCNCEPQEKEYIEIDPGLLLDGTNVLAVSGHNISLDSSDFSLIVELYTNVTLTRGPFLQMPNQGLVRVLWRTAALADSAVDYGFDTNYTGGTVSDIVSTRIHELELPAFPPGSDVYYRVRSGGEILGESRFVSPKIPGQSFRFAIMSDYGSPSSDTVAVAQQALLSNPDVLLTCGDNVQQLSAPVGLFDGNWFGPLAPLLRRVPLMATMGNHDIRIEQGRRYLEALSLPTNGPSGLEERNYSFDYANVHFVILDANAFEPDNETAYTNAADMRPKILTWLTNDLHNTTQTWKFVAYHQPPYTSQGLHGDAEGVKANLTPIFEQYHVNIAFQGHNHFYERINPINGVYYFTVGSGGYSIHGLTNQREFSGKIFRDKYDFLVVDINGQHLILRCIDQDGIQRDLYDIDLSHPFKMDGLLDSTNWVRAVNGLKLNAAIRGPYLYLATQDAGEGNDHFLYLNTNSASMVPYNWSKSGQVMQWAAYLADENGDGGAQAGFYSWFGPNNEMLTNFAVARAVTSGLNNNGTNGNGVLEGTLNLFSQFGSFPTQLLLAAAPVGTLDAGSLISSAQAPAGNGNGDIEPNEFLAIGTRDLALDLPSAEAGTNVTTEAGMWVNLDGSQSTAPSGLPTTFTWSQIDGPAGQLVGANSTLASFRLTNQIGAATSALLRLIVFDSRFDSADTAQINFTVMVDTDGDGLSDQEELTGLDNVLTPIDPRGQSSNPALADTDNDGVKDGEEAIAGTDPNNALSKFELVSVVTPSASGLVLQWSSATGRFYHLWSSTNLLASWSLMESNLPATPPVNSFTAAPPSSASDYFAIEAAVPPQ